MAAIVHYGLIYNQNRLRLDAIHLALSEIHGVYTYTMKYYSVIKEN